MRGIVFTGGQTPAEIRDDVEVRAPGAGELLVRIAAAGLCHSDVSLLEGRIPWTAPALMGHEGAGVVEAVGPGVTRIAAGDHVVISTVSNCASCKWCASGRPTLCRSSISNRHEPFTVGGEPAGNFSATSSFAEVTLIREIQAIKIGPDIPLTSACLLACGVATGVGAVFNRSQVQAGQTAAVFGVGGVGLSVIQALRHRGASRIIGVDVVGEKAGIAMQLGATDFVDASAHDPVAAIAALLPSDFSASVGPFLAGGVDWAFECVGEPAVTKAAFEALDWGGTCVQVGVPAPGVTYAMPILELTMVDRGMLGTRIGSVRPQYDIPMVIDLYRRGLFDLDSMVSKTYPMESFFEAVEDMHGGSAGRAVLTF